MYQGSKGKKGKVQNPPSDAKLASQVCWRFQKGTCKDKTCKRKHTCSSCGSSTHGARLCPEKNQDGTKGPENKHSLSWGSQAQGDGKIVTSSWVKPSSSSLLRVLFVGAERKADLERALRNSLSDYHQLHDTSFQLEMKHLDMLLPEVRQSEIIQNIKRGDFDFVLVAPPCCTFSRALFADLSHSNPLRNYQYPRGLAQLCGINFRRIRLLRQWPLTG